MGRPHKKNEAKKQKKNSSPSAFPDTRQRGPLPSAMTGHSGKPTSLPFAECHDRALGEASLFAECQGATLGKAIFFSFNGVGGQGCQVTFFFAECRSSPSVALGEEGLCRVPLFTECTLRHSAKPLFPECNTRGRLALPSTRFLALGEACDTRRILPLP